MTKLDADGQPNVAFHYHANVAKALNDLIGICNGIAANNVINIEEMTYLGTWLNEHYYLSKDGDYIDLMEQTTELAQSKEIDQCDLEELLEVILCILEFKVEANKSFENSDVAVGRLVGICRGILADDLLDDLEISYLRQWLVKCGDFVGVWPISALRDQIEDVLADGVITTSEREQLF